MKETIKKIEKEAKGITLIALVVTIIVLLILAAVAINLTIGNNGIITRAKDSTEKYEQAAENEQKEMQNVVDFLDKYLNNNDNSEILTIEDAKESGTYFEEGNPKELKDDLQNIVYIPDGFRVAKDSATKVEDGIVVEDKKGNQFVWIPASTTGENINTTLGNQNLQYVRTDFKVTSENPYSSYIEDISEEEKQSVNTYKGYYIGRFEAGDMESTEKKELRKGTDSSSTITIKSNQVPYNYISKSDAEYLAQQMAQKEGYSGKTRLCSSYAWDTALNFIKIKNSSYITNTENGNYNDTSFNYTDISGISTNKVSGEEKIVPTGQLQNVSNIYDMGGNVYEWTTEKAIASSQKPYVARGGSYDFSKTSFSVGARYDFGSGNAEENSGFRVTLYL